MSYILIIEDSRFILSAIKKVVAVELPMFKILIAETETEAKKLISQFAGKIFIVFADLNLPDTKVEGELIEFIGNCQLRTIVLTGSNDLLLRDKISSRLNVIDYVVKDNLKNIQYVTQLAKWIYNNTINSIEAIVIDDSQLPRRLGHAILTSLGFNTEIAEDGKDGFEKIAKNDKIGLVITDLEMPEMNGVELTAKIKDSIKRPIVIIGVTASIDKLEVIKFLKYGANDVVSKPFIKEEFINRIRKDMIILEQTIALENQIQIISIQKDEIEKLATTDHLTQLNNRFKFQQIFDKNIEISKNGENLFTFVIFDIDKFKNVNDTFGHDVGDSVLQELAIIVKDSVRKVDTVARWGGEEFVILLANVNLENAIKIAEKVRVAVESHTFKVVKNITISSGVAQYFEGLSGDEIIKKADALLYKAKGGGRNRVEFI